MTSRTIDIHCNSCRTYLFSLQPCDYDGIAKTYFCNLPICQTKVDSAKTKVVKNKKKKS